MEIWCFSQFFYDEVLNPFIFQGNDKQNVVLDMASAGTSAIDDQDRMMMDKDSAALCEELSVLFNGLTVTISRPFDGPSVDACA